MAVLNYRSGERRRVAWWKVGVGIAVGLIMAWLVFADYAVDDFYVCQECGESVRERHWYGMESLTTKRERSSGVSAVLAAHGVGVTHVHRWVFFSEHTSSLGGARGYACNTGAVSAVLCNAQDCAGFLVNLYSYGDAKTADLWRRRFLDKATAAAPGRAFAKLDSGLMDDSFEKLATKKDFDAWWGKAGVEMEGEFLRGAR